MTITIPAATLILRDHTAPDERDSARRFIQMLGASCTALDLLQSNITMGGPRDAHSGAPTAIISHYRRRYAYRHAKLPPITANNRWRCRVSRRHGDDRLESRVPASGQLFMGGNILY